MVLEDVIKEVVEDLNNGPRKLEVLEILKKRMKKEGFKEELFPRIIGEIGVSEVDWFLKVLETLNKHFNKKGCKWGGCSTYRRSSYKVMNELSKMDSAEDILEILAETGYELEIYKDFGSYIYLCDKDMNIFETLEKNGLYKEYALRFKALKKLGYKKINSYKTLAKVQLDHLIKISQLEGDIIGAIYILASNGCQIDKFYGIDKLDIRGIKKIADEVQKEKVQGRGGSHIYLYEKGDVEIFQDYFNNLSVEDKKPVLESILEYEAKKERTKSGNNKEIKKWLEVNYSGLIKEATFKSSKFPKPNK